MFATNHFALKGKLYQAALNSAFRQLQMFELACPETAITANCVR
jgi:hypothetical protein